MTRRSLERRLARLREAADEAERTKRRLLAVLGEPDDAEADFLPKKCLTGGGAPDYT